MMSTDQVVTDEEGYPVTESYEGGYDEYEEEIIEEIIEEVSDGEYSVEEVVEEMYDAEGNLVEYYEEEMFDDDGNLVYYEEEVYEEEAYEIQTDQPVDYDENETAVAAEAVADHKQQEPVTNQNEQEPVSQNVEYETDRPVEYHDNEGAVAADVFADQTGQKPVSQNIEYGDNKGETTDDAVSDQNEEEPVVETPAEEASKTKGRFYRQLTPEEEAEIAEQREELRKATQPIFAKGAVKAFEKRKRDRNRKYKQEELARMREAEAEEKKNFEKNRKEAWLKAARKKAALKKAMAEKEEEAKNQSAVSTPAPSTKKAEASYVALPPSKAPPELPVQKQPTRYVGSSPVQRATPGRTTSRAGRAPAMNRVNTANRVQVRKPTSAPQQPGRTVVAVRRAPSGESRAPASGRVARGRVVRVVRVPTSKRAQPVKTATPIRPMETGAVPSAQWGAAPIRPMETGAVPSAQWGAPTRKVQTRPGRAPTTTNNAPRTGRAPQVGRAPAPNRSQQTAGRAGVHRTPPQKASVPSSTTVPARPQHSQPSPSRAAAPPPASSTPKYLPYSALKHKHTPGLDNKNREQYLSPAEFQELFNCSRSEYASWPAWKQKQVKIQLGLF